jgi:hypothetical protein
MDASAYHNAAVPGPFKVLRTKLLPYSLGHHLLLSLIESPFITGDAPTYDDLAIAVVICSRPYQEAKAWIHANTKLLRLALRSFEWRVSGKLNPLVWIGLRKPRVINLKYEASEFARYKTDGSHVPYYSIPESTSEFSCPLAHAVWASLLHKTSLTDDQILNRPWSLCLQQYYVVQHFDGVISIREKSTVLEAQAAGEKIEKILAERRANAAPV